MSYFVRKANGLIVEVCAKSFYTITNIGRKRLNNIAKYFREHGQSRPERRGGSRLSEADSNISISIVRFISSLKCRESHYGRGKSVRGYLDPEFSVKKLWRMWVVQRNFEREKTCSYSKFFKIFQTRFNLGFGDPRTDVCSFCEESKLDIRSTSDVKTKLETMTKLRLHKLRAKSVMSY